MTYEVNEDKINEYYDELRRLCDWIPSKIIEKFPEELHVDYFLNLGSKVENKELYFKRIEKHRLDKNRSKLGFEDLRNKDVEIFLKKYPKFKPLFIKVNE